ncbi:MAG: hypothetical protein PHI66_03590 [Candidatus Pacebacteria bacterium]|nr:hypothetical protein [Candidatus Paceibacterota bacterium]
MEEKCLFIQVTYIIIGFLIMALMMEIIPPEKFTCITQGTIFGIAGLTSVIYLVRSGGD